MTNRETLTHDKTVVADWTHKEVWVAPRNRICVHEAAPHTHQAADDYTNTVIFLHGWGLPPRAYQPPIGALAARGVRVIAPALPGFGGSTALSRHDDPVLDVFAERIGDAIQQSGLPQLPIVAHSLGAGVAVRIAQQHPDLFSRMLLVCPIGGADNGMTAWLRILAAWIEEMRHDQVNRALDVLPNVALNPAAFARSGIAAKNANLVDEITALHAAGTDMRIIASTDDHVVPIGAIETALGEHIHTVTGTHGWLLHDPELFADLTLETFTGLISSNG